MRCRYIAGIVAVLLCLGAAVAKAQYYSYMPPDEGPIFRIGLGPSFFQNGRLTQFSAPGLPSAGPIPSTVTYDTGLAAEVALGWAFNKYAALDFETGFIGADINDVSGYNSDNSRLYNVPFLFNFTLSYPIPRTILVPYIGAGIGGADVVFDTDNFDDGTKFVQGSQNDVVFAGQAFAGLRFQISHHSSFDLGYKFFATDSPTFSYPEFGGGPTLDLGLRGARSHSVLFAFKLDF